MKNELFEKDTQQSIPGPVSSNCLQSQVRAHPLCKEPGTDLSGVHSWGYPSILTGLKSRIKLGKHELNVYYSECM